MHIEDNQSEIARLRWRIEKNCEALQRVMNDPGFSASHEMVRRRYEALGRREDQLAGHVGAERAHEITYTAYHQIMQRDPSAAPQHASITPTAPSELVSREKGDE